MEYLARQDPRSYSSYFDSDPKSYGDFRETGACAVSYRWIIIRFWETAHLPLPYRSSLK